MNLLESEGAHFLYIFISGSYTFYVKLKIIIFISLTSFHTYTILNYIYVRVLKVHFHF